MPLRLRITFWIVAIFGVVHLTCSLVLILYERQSVHGAAQARLSQAAFEIAEQASQNPLVAPVELARSSQALRGYQSVAAVGPGHAPARSFFGQVDPADLQRLVSSIDRGGRRAGISETGSSQNLIYATAPLFEGGRLTLAVPIRETERSVRALTYAALLLFPMGILATGIAAWHVSGSSARAFQQVQQFAEELASGHLNTSFHFGDDAPELEALQEELNDAMQSIAEGYETQARFLANVSHEIKTPIAVVRTEGEVLLAGKPSNEELSSFARSTIEEMERLGRMVEAFLLLTRVRQGHSKVKMQANDPNDILMESMGHCYAMAGQHGVRLLPTLYDGEEDISVEGNAELLETALSNLIRNAIRFSPSSHPVVEISCAKSGRRVFLRVRDYGPGLPPEVLEHLFEPFTQSAEERRRGRGTGLGLQIAHGIAELHGGKVRVRNLEQGCEFAVVLSRTAERLENR